MSKVIDLFLSRNYIRVFSLIFVATLALGAIVVAARLNVWHTSVDISHVNATAVPNPRRVQIVRFTLYDAGIYPQEGRANPGRIIISLEDLSGSSAGVIVHRVDENARVPAGVANKAPNSLRSRTELNLPAGRYEVVDATRSGNRALLIVED